MSETTEMIKTTHYKNDDVIKSIMQLQGIEQFDLDCTYSTGVFWKNIVPPVHKTDLYPQSPDVLEANSEDLPFEDNSFKSIMCDLPFVINGKSGSCDATKNGDKEGSNIIAKRFGGYHNFEHLKSNYYNTLKELYRISTENGFVVFKCQDSVSGGINYLTHNMVINMAIEIGYHPKDMYILLAKQRLSAFNGTKWKTQYHARKFHSYFIVLEKTKQKVNYNFDYLNK